MTHLALPRLGIDADLRHMARAKRDRGIVQRRAVLDALRRAGGAMGTAGLAEAVGIKPNALCHHLGRLERAGVVARAWGVVRLARDVHDAGARA